MMSWDGVVVVVVVSDDDDTDFDSLCCVFC